MRIRMLVMMLIVVSLAGVALGQLQFPRPVYVKGTVTSNGPVVFADATGRYVKQGTGTGGGSEYYADGITIVKAGNTFGAHPWITDMLWQHEFALRARGLSDAYDAIIAGAWWYASTNEIDMTASSNFWWNVGFANYLATEDVPEPVGHWKMNDNAADTIVADAMGTNTGTAAANTSTKTIAGKLNGALAFNGSTDWVDISGNVATCTVGDSSVSMWIKPHGTADFQPVLSWWDGSQGWAIFFQGPSGRIVPLPEMLNGPILTTNVWSHIVVVRQLDGNTTIYHNGNLGGQATASPIIAPEVTFTMGAYASHAEYFSSCDLDDVRLYDHALSADQALLLYAGGTGTEEAGLSSAATNMVVSTLARTIVAGPASNVVSMWALTGTNVPATNWLAVDVSGNAGTNWARAGYSYATGISNMYWLTATGGVTTLNPGVIKSRLRVLGASPPRVTVKGSVTMGGSEQ